MAKARNRKARKVRTAEQLAEDERRRVAALALSVGVPKEQVQRGGYESTFTVDLAGELGGRKMSMVPVLVNRGGTAIDRWFANDPYLMFGEKEKLAIEYCRALWIRFEGALYAIDHRTDLVDSPLGWSQQEAMVELKFLEAKIPAPYWSCFERVVRWDEEAGKAGSRLANNDRSAIDAAKTVVAFTASLIAMWRRL